jgi:hypothetical protein
MRLEGAVTASNSTKVLSRRGAEKYTHNPFIAGAAANTKTGVKRISNRDGNRMLVVSENTGEIVAPAGFWQAQEVDKSQFVKLYVNGVKALKDLTSAGTKVFELLYLEVQKNVGKDEIWLSFNMIDQDVTKIGKATFFRGMKELVEKGFVAESTTQSRYFINPDFMWNGDRLAFVKEFRLKKRKGDAVDDKTLDLFGAEAIGFDSTKV